MTVTCLVIRHIYTISSSSPLVRGRGARATPLGARVARVCRFLRIRATRVEMALTVTIPSIHSGSRSYAMDLQSETIGIAVSFFIARFD